MGNKLFGISLFGYTKKDVNTYFENVSQKFSAESDTKDTELTHLREKLSEAQQELDKLRNIKEDFQNSKDKISNAIIQAENKASVIIEDAKRSAVAENIKIQNEIAHESAKLRQLRQEVALVRRSVTALINRFNCDTEKFL